MSLSYHITGAISVLFFSLCLIGIWAQISTIRRRKREMLDWQSSAVAAEIAVDPIPDIDLPVRPTSVLSLNQFFASFLAFYSFLVYGICIEPFNHYLVWTRLIATSLVMLILYEIWHDRRRLVAAVALATSLLLMLVAVGMLVIGGNRVADEGRWIATILAVFAAGVQAQGLTHQVVRIRRSGRTGAVSLKMHQLTTLKDLSTIGFAATMPIGAGWPLMLVSGTGATVKTVVMWHFGWVRRSPIAAMRRNDTSPRVMEAV